MGLDVETFNVCLGGPVHAFGFDMVEIEKDDWARGPGSPFQESTYSIKLFDGRNTLVDSAEFSPGNDKLEFWGVQSAKPFTRVEIRETTGGPENEVFGRFYVGSAACCGGN